MFVKNMVFPPGNVDFNDLNVWRKWEDKFGNYVIGDKFGEDCGGKFPNLYKSSWCSLYSLSILILHKIQGDLPDQTPVLRSPSNLYPDDPLFEKFLQGMESQREYFNQFLRKWNILFLRENNSKYSNQYSNNPWDEDNKIFGLKYFLNMDDVDKYIFLWKNNPEIFESSLFTHRIVASRCIDLICSELLGNAFDHGLSMSLRSKKQAKAFSLAKLCSVKSSDWALKLNKRRGHLSAHEKLFFQESLECGYPLLKLVIADSGKGFLGNKNLVKLYNKLNKDRVNNNFRDTNLEANLIKFALEPQISSKEDGGVTEIEKQWLEYIEENNNFNPENFIPVVHGLSEVKNVVDEMEGFWRIHSNKTILDIYGGREKIESSLGRDIPGCLHYIILPIKQQGYKHSVLVSDSNLKKSSEFRIIDAGAIIFDNNEYEKLKGYEIWRKGLTTLRYELLETCNENINLPVLLNLTVLDSISLEEDRISRTACALLADTIYRCRNKITLLVCGASIKIQSLLRRTFRWKEIFFDRFIIPFIDLFEVNGECGIKIACSEEVKSIKKALEVLLSPVNHDGVVLSDFEGRDRLLLEEVIRHNYGLFEMKNIGSTDLQITGKVKIAQEDIEANRLLLGGRSSSEMRAQLKNNHAIMSKNCSFIRQGKELSFYIHLAYLWENRSFRNKLMDWLPVAAKNMNPRVTLNRGYELSFLGLLHPAIEIARNILLNYEFSNADLVQIRRMGEIRWDSLPVLKLAGKNVICVVDIVHSGKTIQQLVSALKYVEANVIGVLSVIQINDDAQQINEIKHFSFGKCNSAFLEAIGE